MLNLIDPVLNLLAVICICWGLGTREWGVGVEECGLQIGEWVVNGEWVVSVCGE